MEFIDNFFHNIKNTISVEAGSQIFASNCTKYLTEIYKDKNLYDMYIECLQKLDNGQINPEIIYNHFENIQQQMSDRQFIIVYNNFIINPQVREIIKRCIQNSPSQNDLITLYRILCDCIYNVNNM
ncbi:hypothetical protein [Neodiprion sertifer nucleopolyhedrovirus]|uniref:Uncharacterized protein n=1 Tax=Neodiprion sertifer nucleopolyhedrovirus TaxID=111874 RepID=Q6JKB7_9CBAC|nr:hypothetical protein NeseNPV_gp43 [Neodiprion sertifer nucleopolyhedrovirus]AAQ96420.1 hypothetical protein [Neodiprion sertifer nucleopolyhedrovirus]UZH98347.1 hypothetical protein NeseNPV-TR_ORF36 [Neodiprion sertifer nucleopolyhedrovirus]